jgi:putative transcriptional regulator
LENINLTGQFLIAMPAMTDPYFSKTVTYICTHNQDGAMGVIINRSADISVAKLLQQIQLKTESKALLKKTVHFGGPVQIERGFILHEPPEASKNEYDSTIVVNNKVALTTSKDILEACAQDKGPQKMLIALGYAGWTAGQLEQELAQNAWLSLKSDNVEDTHALIFDKTDGEKFDFAMRMMGLDLLNLSDVAGHA